MISVFLVDSEAAIRRHLACLLSLEPDLLVVGQANGRFQPEEIQADVVVLGVLDDHLVRRTRRALPSARLVAWVDRTQGHQAAEVDVVVDRFGPLKPLLAALRQGPRRAVVKSSGNEQPLLPSVHGS